MVGSLTVFTTDVNDCRVVFFYVRYKTLFCGRLAPQRIVYGLLYSLAIRSNNKLSTYYSALEVFYIYILNSS